MAEEADSSGTTGSSGANWWSPTTSCSSVSATMVSGIRMHANNNNNTSPLNYCSSSTNVNEEVGSPSLTTTNNNNNNSTITMESSGLTHQELGVDSFLDHSSHIPPFANGETTNNIWTQMLLGGCNEEELQSTSNTINMNMIYPPQMKKMNNNKWVEAHEHNMRLPSMLHNPMMQLPIQVSNGMSFGEMVPHQYLNQNQQPSFCRSPLFDLGKVKQEKSLLSSHSELQQVQSIGMNHSNITGGNKQWPSHHHQLNLPQQNNNKVIDFSSSKTHSDQPKRQQLHPTNNNIKCLGKQPNNNNNMNNEDQQRPDASINTKPDHNAADMPLFKRPRIESTSTVTTFKVRKEKLGDRITALQQLVNPFGKTDTASVLLEAIGYIKFLQEQVQVLSTPYLKSGETLIQTKPNQMSWDKDSEEPALDLRSRGLCLVPVSCTLHVANDNGADYWSGNYR